MAFMSWFVRYSTWLVLHPGEKGSGASAAQAAQSLMGGRLLVNNAERQPPQESSRGWKKVNL